MKDLISHFLKHNKQPRFIEEQLSAFIVSQVIGSAIVNRRPFLASRLGFTEAQCLTQKEGLDHPLPHIMERIWQYSGVFPCVAEQFQAFAGCYLESLRTVDLLGLICTQTETVLVERYAPNVFTCSMGALEPYLCSTPWSQHLKGLRVCVIHPFAGSIAEQYANLREKIFFDEKVLPAFELRVVKAPQTLAGNSDGFPSWSEALKHLIDEVECEDFDVAIVGCGAYGLPVGAHAKKLGKVAIHLGGATQLLFGIAGKRWCAQPAFRAIMTDAWHPPLESERPPGWEKIEDGCYW